MSDAKLLRYMPPKSSIWGHRMGRKKPAVFRDAVSAFLRQAARAYETRQCYLSTNVPHDFDAGAEFVREFAESVGLPSDLAMRKGLTYINNDLFEHCLDWFVLNASRLPARQDRFSIFYFSMAREHKILNWQVNSFLDSLQVGGEIVEDYGSLPYVGTTLTFRDIDEFRWVSRVAFSTLGIRLNEKHLRPRRTAIG